MYLLNYIKSTNPLAQVWSVHHSGHTYPTRLCVAHLQSKLNWVSCVFLAALLRWQHTPGCAVVTVPPNLSIFKEPKLILVQMTPTLEGPCAVIKPPHPRWAATTVGAAGPVSKQSVLRTLVLAINGANPEGKRQFRSEFISQAGPVV